MPHSNPARPAAPACACSMAIGGTRGGPPRAIGSPCCCRARPRRAPVANLEANGEIAVCVSWPRDFPNLPAQGPLSGDRREHSRRRPAVRTATAVLRQRRSRCSATPERRRATYGCSIPGGSTCGSLRYSPNHRARGRAHAWEPRMSSDARPIAREAATARVRRSACATSSAACSGCAPRRSRRARRRASRTSRSCRSSTTSTTLTSRCRFSSSTRPARTSSSIPASKSWSPIRRRSCSTASTHTTSAPSATGRSSSACARTWPRSPRSAACRTCFTCKARTSTACSRSKRSPMILI